MSRQALSGLRLEYPHKADHLWLAADGPLEAPSALHPVFYGNYDWHSAVHSHWCLVRLLRKCPQCIDAPTVADALRSSVTASGCAAEAAYFEREGAATFERPYGWGWLLKLAAECALAEQDCLADDTCSATAHRALFRSLSQHLQPLADKIKSGWMAYLPKLGYPVRSGVHSNTAFGLSLSLDYAETAGDEELHDAIAACAKRLYSRDVGYDPVLEPSGEDFLSPGLCEIELMRRVLPSPAAFVAWVGEFMPTLCEAGVDGAATPAILHPPTVSDRSDARLCHLDGLLLSKAWMLRSLSRDLAAGGAPEALVEAVAASASEHYDSASWMTSRYVGSHWLHSFALLALDADGGRVRK